MRIIDQSFCVRPKLTYIPSGIISKIPETVAGKVISKSGAEERTWESHLPRAVAVAIIILLLIERGEH